MANYTESSRASIIKLNSNNYHLWRFGAEMLLLKEDLWEIVTSARPEKITDEWTRKDNSARATIALSVEASLHSMISNCVSSKEMWIKIKTHFERESYSSRIFLKRKLYATKLERNDMEGYINQISSIVERLRLAGEVITDKEIISMLLCGLNEEYDGLIMAIEGKNEEDVRLENIKIKLIDEAKRKEDKHNMLIEQQQVMMAGTSRTDRTEQRQPRLCYECRSPGHIRINCPRIRNYGKRSETAGINNRRNPNNSETNFVAGVEEKPEEARENYYSYITCENGITGVHDKNVWILDSGATTHMCNTYELIDEYVTYKSARNVIFANGDKSEAYGEGELNYVTNNVSIVSVSLGKVIYVPSVIVNLLSVPELCKEGFNVFFKDNKCDIVSNDSIVLSGSKNCGIYEILLETKTTNIVMTACIHRWHARMGHRAIDGIEKLRKTCDVKGLKIDRCNHDDSCSVCDKTKLCQKSYERGDGVKSEEPFSLLHSDVCGPIVPKSKGGGSYFVTIVDDYSRYCYLKVVRNKSDTFTVIKNFIDHYFNKFKYHPQFLRSDCGGEYGGQNLNDYLTEKGILHQNSIAYHHEQNGLSERINRTLVAMTKAIINYHKLDKKLWGEVVSSACYLYNKSIHSYTKETPHKMWTGKPPDVSNLRIIGSKVVYWVPKELRSKLSDNGRDGILLGYGDTIKGYRILDVESDKVVYARTVRFNEENTYHYNQPEENREELEIVFPLEKLCNDPMEDAEKPRRSNRVNMGKRPSRYEE